MGGGGREHALVWKLRQSLRVTDLLRAPATPASRRWPRRSSSPSMTRTRWRSLPLKTELILTSRARRRPRRGRGRGVWRAPPSPVQAWQGAGPSGGKQGLREELMRELGIPTAEFEVFRRCHESD